jgi:Fic family protein
MVTKYAKLHASAVPDPRELRALLEDPRYAGPEQEGRYLHWEQLRHRPAPPGASSESWWWLVRMARANLSRPLPLHDVAGTAFQFAMTDSAHRLVHGIDRDASGQIMLPEDVANPAVRDRYVVRSLVEEAFRSSEIEGASTTRAAAKEMIRSARPPRTISERMILNTFHALEWVRDHRDQPLTPDAVLELHSIVTDATLDPADAAGRLRRPAEDVRVIDTTANEVIHVPPPADQLAARLVAMCAFANGTWRDEPFVHPVVRAILLHFWLAYDHPFVDGNGRTARALFYWSMLAQGYWLTEFVSISRVILQARAKYDRAFVFAETDANDATYFVLHQLAVLRTAIDDLHGYLARKAQEVRAVEDSLRGRVDLNPRQLAILSEALRRPDARITIDEHRRASRVVYQTARTDLLGLVARGYLDQHKQGKRLAFAPVKDLARRLEPPR